MSSEEEEEVVGPPSKLAKLSHTEREEQSSASTSIETSPTTESENVNTIPDTDSTEKQHGAETASSTPAGDHDSSVSAGIASSRHVATVIPDSLNTDCCAICMETDPTVTMLERHNCPQCVPTAWKICEGCDAQLLSRSCPICQHEYKELMLYSVTDIPQMPINFMAIGDTKERYLVTMKTRFMFEILSRSNSAVWSPSSSRMFFSLPTDMSVPVADMRFILLSIPITPDRLIDGNKFMFVSSVWDEIEHEIEHGDSEANHFATAKEAARWLMAALKTPGAMTLTPLTPREWEDIVADFSLTFDRQV